MFSIDKRDNCDFVKNRDRCLEGFAVVTYGEIRYKIQGMKLKILQPSSFTYVISE